MHVSKQPGMASGEEIRRKKQIKHLPITLDLLPLSKICSPLFALRLHRVRRSRDPPPNYHGCLCLQRGVVYQHLKREQCSTLIKPLFPSKIKSFFKAEGPLK